MSSAFAISNSTRQKMNNFASVQSPHVLDLREAHKHLSVKIMTSRTQKKDTDQKCLPRTLDRLSSEKPHKQCRSSVFSRWSRSKTREVCGLQALFTADKTVLEVVLLNSCLFSDSTRWQLSKALEGKEAACVKTTLLHWSWFCHDKANVGELDSEQNKQHLLRSNPMRLLASWSLANSFLSPQKLPFAVHWSNSQICIFIACVATNGKVLAHCTQQRHHSLHHEFYLPNCL